MIKILINITHTTISQDQTVGMVVTVVGGICFNLDEFWWLWLANMPV
jgi:hypothetical protein